jgi:hypothetical protein
MTTDKSPAFERVWPLIEAACLGTISDEELRQLQDVLRGDASLQRVYLEYCRMHAELRYLHRAQRANDAVLAKIAQSATVRPALGVADGAWDGAAGYLVQHPMLLSYLVATACFAVVLLVGSLVRVSHDYPSPTARTAPARDESRSQEAVELVGRITGMVDCRWAGSMTETIHSDVVCVGRKYVLVSGLMEITYDTGAKVILQGPATYEVQSNDSGYLSFGKLTARVEKKDSGSGVQGSESTHPSSFIPHPSSLFSVRTPTAVVTDLGTEFGVEVSKEGATTSHVFRGSVRVRVAAGDGKRSEAVLRENESARVEKREGGGGPRLLLDRAGASPVQFVRRLAEPPKALDLLDVVAGGNGMGNRREHGIDPTTGDVDYVFYGREGGFRTGNHQYNPTTWSWFIDGVFMPDGSAGAVRLDSAGNTFDGFPKSTNRCYGSLWSRAAAISEEHSKGRQQWIYSFGPGRQFMPEGRGLLGFCGDMAITFNLEATRKMYPGLRPSQFHAVAGVADCRPLWPSATPLARLWIFVDGRLKLSRAEFRPEDGALSVDVEIGAKDRFLTLAIINGSTKDCGDWVVFGDPVLRMTSTEDREEGRQTRP